MCQCWYRYEGWTSIKLLRGHVAVEGSDFFFIISKEMLQWFYVTKSQWWFQPAADFIALLKKEIYLEEIGKSFKLSRNSFDWTPAPEALEMSTFKCLLIYLICMYLVSIIHCIYDYDVVVPDNVDNHGLEPNRFYFTKSAVLKLEIP